MWSAATLAAMPPEVLENIADLAEPADLKAMRLVSRDMAAKVLRTCARELFAHQGYYLNSEAHLAHALVVAKHPVFGPALRTLSLRVLEVRPASELEDEFAVTREKDASHKRKMHSLGMPPNLKHERKLEDLERRAAAWHEQEQFRHQGGQNQALRALMEQIRRNGKVIRIFLTDCEGCGIRLLDLGENCVMSRVAAVPPELGSAEPFRVVHQALQQAEILGSIVISMRFHAARWSLPASVKPGLSFEGLNELQLELNTERHFHRRQSQTSTFLVDREADVRPLLDALVAVTSSTLRILTIHVRSFDGVATPPPGPDRADIIWLLLKETLPSLVDLKMAGGYAKIQTLVAFAQRHPTLVRLDLAIVHVGGWDEDVTFAGEEIQKRLGIGGRYMALRCTDW